MVHSAVFKKISLKKLFQKLIQMFYDQDIFAVCQRDLTIPPHILLKTTSFKMQKLTYDNLHQFEKYYSHKLDLFKKRLDSGLDCFYCTDGDLAIGYTWASPKNYYEPYINYDFQIDEDQIYQFDGEVLPEYRGKQVAYLGVAFMWRYYVNIGKKTAIAYFSQTKRHAKASQHMHKKMDFTMIGSIHYTRFLFKKTSHFKPELKNL